MLNLPELDPAGLLGNLEELLAACPQLNNVQALQSSLELLRGVCKAHSGDVVATVIELLRRGCTNVQDADATAQIKEWVACYDDYHALVSWAKTGDPKSISAVTALARWDMAAARRAWST